MLLKFMFMSSNLTFIVGEDELYLSVKSGIGGDYVVLFFAVFGILFSYFAK